MSYALNSFDIPFPSFVSFLLVFQIAAPSTPLRLVLCWVFRSPTTIFPSVSVPGHLRRRPFCKPLFASHSSTGCLAAPRRQAGRTGSLRQAPRSCHMQSMPGWPDPGRNQGGKAGDREISIGSNCNKKKVVGGPNESKGKTYTFNSIPLFLGHGNGLSTRRQRCIVVIAVFAQQAQELVRVLGNELC